MSIKTLIILIILIGLCIGGFFVWKNFFVPEKEKTEEETEEEVYIYKGIWLPGLSYRTHFSENWLASNIEKMKDLGMNTVYLAAMFIQEDGNPLAGINTSQIVKDIQVAHDNGMKIMLNTHFHPKPKLEEKDLEKLDSLIVEVARIAQEYDVGLFAPLSEPETILLVDSRKWGQEILPKVKQVYHGEVFWDGAFGPPDKPVTEEYFRQIAEQPPGDFVGYDYIGFPIYFISAKESLEPEEQVRFAEQLTLESYSEYVDRLIKYMLAFAERDSCKGVIIKEFGVADRFYMKGSELADRLVEGTLTEEKYTRAHEIVFEKGKDKVAGFMTVLDVLETDFYGTHLRIAPKTQELIRKWFTEILD